MADDDGDPNIVPVWHEWTVDPRYYCYAAGFRSNVAIG
jgi:hypothetical protein